MPIKYLIIIFVPLLQNRIEISETDHINHQINGMALKISEERIDYWWPWSNKLHKYKDKSGL